MQLREKNDYKMHIRKQLSYIVPKGLKMKKYKHAIVFIITAGLILPLTSCGYINGRITTDPYPNDQYVQDNAAANRFTESGSEQTTVVESAIEISQKYAAVSEEAIQLKQRNQQLAAENSVLNSKVKKLEQELSQTQKELTEANELLIDMRVELNNWKTNVLGFRDEIRQADSEQLKALIKIIEILGGKIQTQTTSETGDINKSVGMNTEAQQVNENIGS